MIIIIGIAGIGIIIGIANTANVFVGRRETTQREETRLGRFAVRQAIS